MDRQELADILTAHQIPRSAYSLSGGVPSEAHCLSKESNGTWCVYYSERGRRSAEAVFELEGEACECLLTRIRSDAAYGKQW
jgi:hypothetical protein